MKELNRGQNMIFRLGGILFVLGLAFHLFLPFPGMMVYIVGVLAFTCMQMLCRYEGSNFTIARLRRQQLFSDFAFILSAALMLMQEMEWGPYELRCNGWMLALIVGCIFQLYTAFRIPQEIEKQKKIDEKHASKLLGMIALCAFLLPSCSTQYKVAGTTNVSGLEGELVYLKTFHENDMMSLDSCKVQHGRLTFGGALDSTMIAFVFDKEMNNIPVVLESGDIKLTLNASDASVTGTELNDSLNAFLHSVAKIENDGNKLAVEMDRLSSLDSRMVMDGFSEDERVMKLSGRAQQIDGQLQQLNEKADKMITSFIIKNSDNVLGAGVFMILTTRYPYPQITPQISEIMFRAKPFLKNYPYVVNYMKAAQENMDKIHMGE